VGWRTDFCCAGRRWSAATLGALVCLSAALMWLLPSPAGAGDMGVATASSFVVLSPRAGQRVRTYPLTIRVRATDEPDALRAWLNGRSIQSQFGVSRRGVRSLEVSISQGLRRGANLLRVWTRRRSGLWRKSSIRFSVVVERRLAGAGPDVRVVVGDPYTLAGSSLAAVGRTRPASGPVRWQLVDHPPNSKPPAISDPSAQNPVFTPDVPGRYTFKFTDSSRLGSTADTVTLAAVPPNPLVPIETMATEGGQEGIRVGQTFYQARGSETYPRGTYNYFQVLVLDRATLGFVSSTTYQCNPPAGCDDIARDLSRLDNSKLVVAAWHPVVGRLLSSSDILHDFKSVGAPKPDPGVDIRPGNASLIGIPGLPQGQADVKLAPDSTHTNGDMVGYFTPDQYFNYAWLPRDRERFDTRAPLGAGDSHVFQIGGTAHKLSALNGAAGFHVVVVDRLTLRGARGDFFNTGTSDDAARLAAFLKDVTPRELVFIAAVNAPGKATLDVSANGPALGALATAIASVGGTRDLFNRSGMAPGSNYSLVGWGGAGEGNGQETSALKDPDPGDGRLRGTLSRDHQYSFKPTVTSTQSQPPDALPGVMVSSPSAWPLAGNAGAQKAIAFIGSQPQTKELGADPRAQYWMQTFGEGRWYELAREVRDVAYPGNGHGFTEAEFVDARKEIAQEMTWVGKVRAYMKILSSQFGEDQKAIEAKLTTIYDEVKNALKPTAAQRTTLKWLEITDAISKLVGKVNTVTGVISSVYDLGVKYLAEIPSGEEQASEINDTVDRLKLDVVTRLVIAQSTFRSMGDIIVGDYEKLKTVGTLAQCSASAAGCPREWQFTPQDKDAAAVAVSRSVEAQFDQALLKATFPAYTLGPATVHRNKEYQVTTAAKDYYCGAYIFFPFRDEPDNGQVALLQEAPDKYQLLVLANLSNLTEFHLIPNLPPRDILDRMFTRVSPSLDAGAGGLGIYRPDFMRTFIKGDYNKVDKPGGFVCGGGYPWNP
jgi:hypothetical protein